MADSFQGTTALVTGASQGIGAATAIALARHGAAKVIVHYSSSREKAENVAREVERAGSASEMIQADLGCREQVRSFAAALKDRRIDILINNAGSLVKREKFLDIGEDLWDRVFTLNLHSVMAITQSVLPHMIAQKRGIVVNVSSIAARNGGGIGASAYAAAKAA